MVVALTIDRHELHASSSIVYHVHPEEGHGFVERRAARPLRAGAVLDEGRDRSEDLLHALAAAVAIQQQPRDAQVRAMVPRLEAEVRQLAEENVVVLVVAR